MSRREASLVHTALALIPPILLAGSFALSLKSTLAGDWAVRENYSVLESPPIDYGPLHRSPFATCTSALGNHSVVRNGTTVDVVGYYEQCTRHALPGAACDATGVDYAALCQQIDLSARLLMVNCVFAGLACAMSWVLCLARIFAQRPRGPKPERDAQAGDEAGTSGNPHHHRRHRVAHAYPSRSYTTSPLHLFAIIAAVAAFLAAMIGGNALVNLSAPNADFAGSAGSGLPADAAWQFDTGYSYASASWVLAAFGAAAAQWV